MNRRLTAVLAGVVLPLVPVACGGDGDEPMGPDRSDLEIRVVSGDGQFAVAGQRLAEPLTVQVRDRTDLDPESGIPVDWAIVQGVGATLSQQSTVTNAEGRASVSLTLGSENGDYRVEATFEGLTSAPATFQARAVVSPIIEGVPDAPVQAGEVITITGQNFSPNSGENLVLFSGIRGAVTSASATALQVRVPPCLPTRSVDVTAGFGAVRSPGVPLEVEASGSPLGLEVGQDRTTSVEQGLECVKLEAGTRWVAVVQSASEIDGPTFQYELTGLLGGDPTGSQARAGFTTEGGATRGAGLTVPPGATHARWEAVVRGLERSLPPLKPAERGKPAAARAPAAVPEVGDRRDFSVLNEDREFDRVTAEAVFVGDRAVMYRDLDAPDNGLTSGDFRDLAQDFDDFIHPTVTGIYGTESDLDGNQRVVILFTPVVNRLTKRGSEGFVGGFFFGLDLLPERDNSNGAEIFYTLVADPDGEFSDPRSRDLILRVVPGVLAHEFQHMVNFNQRALIRGGSFADVLWLSEAVALMAEDVVGEAVEAAGDSGKALFFQAGNWARAQRYLRDPPEASLVATQGQGSLEERGSWWLLFRYLRGQRGDNTILAQLTQTTRTGVANVEAVTGEQWPSLVADWSAAVILDDQGVPVPDRLQFPDLDLRATINRLEDGWPLTPTILGGSDFHRLDALVASSPAYFELRPATAGGVVQAMGLNLAGPAGGAPVAGAVMQLTLVRIQ